MLKQDKKKKESSLKKILSILLLLFVIFGGGYSFVIITRTSAHKLAGGSEYERLAKNNADYEGEVKEEEGKTAFFDASDISNMQEEISNETMNDKLLNADTRNKAKEALRKGNSVSLASSIAAERINNDNVDFFEDINKSKITTGKNMSSKTEGFSDGSGNGVVTVVPNNAQEKKQDADADSGVLGALKDALRSALSAKRVASKDAAKNWGAKSFDGNDDIGAAIQYDDKTRMALDYFDPNQIPQFLREQDLGPDDAKEIAESEVLGMEDYQEYDTDVESDQNTIKDEGPQFVEKATDVLLAGMVNPIFTGLIPKYQKPQKDPYDISNSNLSSGDALSDPFLDSIDEDGLITYGSKKGFQMVYDMEGNFIGCMDNVTKFFKTAGSPGCPR